MSAVDTGIFISVIVALISVATFYIGRTTSAKRNGAEWGELTSDVRHIREDVQYVKKSVREINEKFIDHLEKFHSNRQ